MWRVVGLTRTRIIDWVSTAFDWNLESSSEPMRRTLKAEPLAAGRATGAVEALGPGEAGAGLPGDRPGCDEGGATTGSKEAHAPVSADLHRPTTKRSPTRRQAGLPYVR